LGIIPAMNSSDGIITCHNGKLIVPDEPIIPFIEGDGSGPDLWHAARKVIDAAVENAHRGKRKIKWVEVFAGDKAQTLLNNRLPDETLFSFCKYLVGIKGPLATPVGEGFRSLNIALRQSLDLYVCLRPVRWFSGLPSPVQRPELVNMVIFRENTEDVYSGIEFENGSPQSNRFKSLLKNEFPDEFNKIRFPNTCGLGIKPVSSEGSKRLVRAAIRWAIDNNRHRVTLIHKGNIMKYTEGAFRTWGYEVAQSEFGDQVYTSLQKETTIKRVNVQAANDEQASAIRSGKILVNDVIADAAFEQVLTRPTEFDVLATTNLNGDYLSDALAAQVGGLGIAPGANINFDTGAAIFEATHGTAPNLAGQNIANPGSLILSGEMMLRYLGWNEAAENILKGLENAINNKTVTFDLYNLMEDAILLNTSEFGDAVINAMV
jgi:isocitrate dehydrogenase